MIWWGAPCFNCFKKAELSIKNIRDNFLGAEPGRKENMVKSWGLAVEAVWRMIPPGKQAVALSEEAFPKRDSVADYWIIEDKLDDERLASRLWEKIAAECAER